MASSENADTPEALIDGLRRDLAPGLDEPLYEGDVWARCERAADLLAGMRVQGRLGEGPVRALLAALPPPKDARQRTIAHLLRALLLRDGAATTAVLWNVVEDMAARQPRHTLEQADYILRAIVYGVWSNRLPVADIGDHDRALRALWRVLVDRYRPVLAGRGAVPAGERQRDLVVLLTGQFMQGMHQPSLDILDFARTLIVRFGRRVALINTADGPVSAHFPFLGRFSSASDPALYNASQLMSERLPIPFLHLPAGFTPPELAAGIVDEILGLKPDLVLSFGTMSPVADLCRGLLDVVSIPFGTYLPMAQPTWVALPRALTAGDEAGLAASGLDRDRVIPIAYTYAPPVTGTPKTRAELGVPEDAIAVAIIGLRLGDEVTPSFAATLDDLVRQEPRLFFLFIGPMDNHADLVASLPDLARRSKAHGYDPDVVSVLAACDLYLNPPRGGGGASAAYAMSRGVPAYSLASGDVATVVGPGFHLPVLTDFATRATRFADDVVERERLREAARRRFDEISSRREMLRQVLDGVKAMRAKG